MQFHYYLIEGKLNCNSRSRRRRAAGSRCLLEDGERRGAAGARKQNKSKPGSGGGCFGRRALKRRCSDFRGENVFVVIINYCLVSECTRVDTVRVPCNRREPRRFAQLPTSCRDHGDTHTPPRQFPGPRPGPDTASPPGEGESGPAAAGAAGLEEERRRAVGRIGAAGFVPSPLPRGNPAHRETLLGSFRQFFFIFNLNFFFKQ